jgi:hypothetical protein
LSNVNAPFGLRPVGRLDGSPYTAGARVYSVPASDGTAIYVGDPVKLVGTGQIINGSPMTDVARANTGDTMVGVCIGALPDTRDSTQSRAASTQRRILVADDPSLIFEVQQSNSGTAFSVNDIGLNCNINTSTAGSAITSLSGVVADNATGATTNTLDLKIVGVLDAPDNDVGSAAGTGSLASRLLVRINRHAYVNQSTGV